MAGAAHAVGGEVHVALELDERTRRVVAEDAVFPAGVEAEPVQAALELGDVVAAQHRAAAVEQAVAEAVPALDHRRPGLRAADAVDPQAPGLLEGAHDRFGRGARTLPTRSRGIVVTRGGEPDLEVAHRLAAAARPEDGRFAQVFPLSALPGCSTFGELRPRSAVSRDTRLTVASLNR